MSDRQIYVVVGAVQDQFLRYTARPR